MSQTTLYPRENTSLELLKGMKWDSGTGATSPDDGFQIQVRTLQIASAASPRMWKGRPLRTEADRRRMLKPPFPPEPGYE